MLICGGNAETGLWALGDGRFAEEFNGIWKTWLKQADVARS
jgi:hypothetical protein